MVRRKLRRKRNKRQVRVVMTVAFVLLLTMTVGYAAFSTNVSLNAKGNIKEYNRVLATTYIQNLKNSGDTTLIDDETDDHNIRYSGKNVNNYVCMENEKTCSEENLYRIIGVFNVDDGTNHIQGRIKLIKATELTTRTFDNADESRKSGYCADYSSCNAWAAMDNYNNGNISGKVTKDASLNTYLNQLALASHKLIDNAVWYLGGVTSENETLSIYTQERANGVSTWTGKIALMYPSDYGYASSNCYNDNTHLNSYNNSNCTSNNWLFNNQANNGRNHEWTLSPISTNSYFVTFSHTNGALLSWHFYANYECVVRPSFYLKANVNIIENGNDGSIDKPYILELGS